MGALDFENLTELADLDHLFERSREQDVVLFLHDYWCPISSRAYEEMALVEGEIALIDVATGRDLTQTIATRTGVKHESPQVLILRDAQARWVASHGSITQQAVGEAMATP
ncbi:MAG: bacillithiol system redox-active protein YtxJ [Dehalococcoidia bacterium]|nr:bacillithiol system redox-active protein YtxJ [Dehalococcoidia bacterium]HCU99566.1 bacillithiol system redox-active protein YtxJ [Dehalococcoidia bacterium]|tara:strand:- start:108 stop:440 length:333 start_codon:yes stop_codon:yes gene_type:complete